ncbi:thrombospondin-1-like [Mizuhopecten yessoensis]|uniref:thrombospondin-1-like n=1 Tax=Mizuhopecten yessoensis TaxID=6573 RepID=UPI000B45BC9F|nr:thrombospondin-1-like [Mizuhopecten yessoensis]
MIPKTTKHNVRQFYQTKGCYGHVLQTMNSFIILEIICFLYQVSLTVGEAKGHRSLGSWGEWSAWSKCSVTCGYGTSSRHKEWRQPDKKDKFPFYDIIECWSAVECPVHGRWSIWQEWTVCPVMCNGGVQRRERHCNEPGPKFGGNKCYGAKWEGKECGMQKCPVIPANFTMASCDHTSFICDSRRHCVPGGQRCDGILQCHDGSDERKCFSYVFRWNGVQSSGDVLMGNAQLLTFSLAMVFVVISQPT